MEDVTLKLAEFNSRLTFEQISGAALKNAKKCLLDTIGCAFFGATTPWGSIVKEFVRSQGGVRESTLWATDFSGPSAGVVLANGTMIHSFDFDDYHMTKIHPGAVVIPAALALGEREGIDGKQLLTAIVAGYETMIHVSRGINPGASRLKGWHLTGTCGTLAAAAAAGHILGFDTPAMASALGMAGTQSAGLWAFTADGSFSKRFHPGRSAQSGIIAALLAQRGYEGPTRIIEAEDGGLFKATSDDYRFSDVTLGLGEVFDTEDVVIKPYPACGSLHSSIDAVLAIRGENGIDSDQVKNINVFNSEVVNVQCGFAYSPMGALQAQMSLKYCVARAMMDGVLTISQFKEDKLSEPAAVDLAGRVNFIKHDEINNVYPRRFPSIVEVVMKDGATFTTRIDSPKGSHENPLSWEQVREKFMMNSSDIINADKADEIADRIDHVEEMTDVSVLAKLLRG